MTDKKDYYETLSPVAESFRVLRTNVKRLFAENNWKTLVITGSGPGEGATTVSLELARSLQKNGDKVLLIDANLRLPALNTRMQQEGEGLSEILTGEERGNLPILQQDNEPPMLLAGAAAENPAEILGSRAMMQLLDSLRDHYDYIVLDTPPAAVVADATILGSQADAVLLVVEDGVAEKRQVRNAIHAIEQAGGNLVGAVMNKTEPRGKS